MICFLRFWLDQIVLLMASVMELFLGPIKTAVWVMAVRVFHMKSLDSVDSQQRKFPDRLLLRLRALARAWTGPVSYWSVSVHTQINKHTAGAPAHHKPAAARGKHNVSLTPSQPALRPWKSPSSLARCWASVCVCNAPHVRGQLTVNMAVFPSSPGWPSDRWLCCSTLGGFVLSFCLLFFSSPFLLSCHLLFFSPLSILSVSTWASLGNRFWQISAWL